MKIEEFTQKLYGALFPYLGRLEYGNLRKSASWPQKSSISERFDKVDVYWLAWESSFGSTMSFAIMFNPNGTLNLDTIKLHSENHMYSLKTGLDRFMMVVKSIPNYRLKKTIGQFKKYRELGQVVNIDEVLEKVYKIKSPLTKYYTDFELESIYNYIKSI